MRILIPCLTLGLALLPWAIVQGQTGELKILILSGDAATHRAGKAAAGSPITIRVVNESGQPVEGAQVVFGLPSDGPGAAFVLGRIRRTRVKTITLESDQEGMVKAPGMVANAYAGPFVVRVAAREGGRTGNTEIPQTNVDLVTADAEGRGSGFFWRFLAVGVGLVSLVVTLLAL